MSSNRAPRSSTSTGPKFGYDGLRKDKHMTIQYGLMGRIPAPGTKVRFTHTFLHNTGQQVGGEGSKVFTTLECPCRLCKMVGDFVAVDEPHFCQTNPRGYEDIAPEDRPKFRHIRAGNLEVVR